MNSTKISSCDGIMSVPNGVGTLQQPRIQTAEGLPQQQQQQDKNNVQHHHPLQQYRVDTTHGTTTIPNSTTTNDIPMVYATLVTFDDDDDTEVEGDATTTNTPSTAIVGELYRPEMLQNRNNNNNNNNDDDIYRCLLHGCLCYYIAIDCNFHTIGCYRTHDCLCIRHNSCCALYHPSYGCNISTTTTTNNTNNNNNNSNESSSSSSSSKLLLNMSCFCCEWGLIQPYHNMLLCSSTEQCLCFQAVGSIPFHQQYVPYPILAYYGCTCLPTFCNFCIKPPSNPSIPQQQQRRQQQQQYQPLSLSSSTTMYRD